MELRRRKFIKQLAHPTAIVSALSAQRVLGANERVRVGVIGFGLVGRIHTRSFKGLPDSEVVAVDRLGIGTPFASGLVICL